MDGTHYLVLFVLGAAVVLSCSALVQMLVARRAIRSSTQWNAIFFPSGAFVVMSVVILFDVGNRTSHSLREDVLIVATFLLALGATLGVRSLVRAMRGQQVRDDELAVLRLRYERLFKANEMPIVVFERESLRVVDVNDSALLVLGGTRAGLLSTTFDALSFGQDVRAEFDRADSEGRQHVELNHRERDGGSRDLLVHLSTGDVAGAHLTYGIIEDVTERNAARVELLEQKELLAHLADHDALTGLANRRVLDVVLEHAYARGRRGVPGSLLFIDVDDFKEVNDRQGHEAGDAVLVAIARVLENGVRAPGDVIVRLGGDEFAILLEDTDLPDATVIAERLVASVRDGFEGLGLSVGVASVRGASDTLEVVRRADVCMYAAKAAGGSRVIVATPQPADSAPVVPLKEES